MKNYSTYITKLIKQPWFFLSLACFILAFVTVTSSHRPLVPKQQNVLSATNTHTQKPSHTPIPPTQKEANQNVTPTTVSSPTPTPITQSNTQTNPTNTPIPPTQAPEETKTTISMTIQDPNGDHTFTIDAQNVHNACDTLTQAKQEGKISSVTIDDRYKDSLHSAYVSEINGFKNSWTFEVNGSSPQGCSLIEVKPRDSVVWKFN